MNLRPETIEDLEALQETLLSPGWKLIEKALEITLEEVKDVRNVKAYDDQGRPVEYAYSLGLSAATADYVAQLLSLPKQIQDLVAAYNGNDSGQPLEVLE